MNVVIQKPKILYLLKEARGHFPPITFCPLTFYPKDILPHFFLHISLAYLSHILGISQAYLGHISGISWAYLGHILGISWAYLGHTLGISWAYLGHISGILSFGAKRLGAKCLLASERALDRAGSLLWVVLTSQQDSITARQQIAIVSESSLQQVTTQGEQRRASSKPQTPFRG